MFYRYATRDIRLATDLDDMFTGEPCFIVGGAPDAKQFGEIARAHPGAHILAINNAGTVVPRTLRVGGDKPACYSESILVDPTIMKFAVISRRNEMVMGRRWAEWPNTFFFGTNEGFNPRNFLDRSRDLVWWKNTFFIAIQLAYRLGFREIYLAGCGFKISKEQQYAWETKLGDDEIAWNTRLYNDSVAQLKALMPHFQQRGLHVTSCTPGSLANDVLPFEEPAKAWERIVARIPAPNTVDKPHSSKLVELKKEEVKPIVAMHLAKCETGG